MKSIKVVCPYCHSENKLTVFQSETASIFSAKCKSCGREFNIDSEGNVVSTPRKESMPAQEKPPTISPEDKRNIQGIIDEIKRAEKQEKPGERLPIPPPPDEKREIPPAIPVGPPMGYAPSQPPPYGQPPYPGYPAGAPAFPPAFQRIPFLRNPRTAGKLLIVSAVLGIITAVLLFMTINMMMNGEISDITVKGRVLNGNGAAISNATLTVTDMNISATTDSSGHYVLSGVNSGTHTIRVSAPGYRTAYYRVTIEVATIDKETEENFVLHKSEANATSDEKFDRSINPDSYYSLPTFMVITSVFTFLGGIAAMRRTNYIFTLIASVLAIFNLGLIIVSFFLGVTALYILLKSKYAFSSGRSSSGRRRRF